MSEAMTPGFADPPLEAQTMFRLVLDAMARPGRIKRLISGNGRSIAPDAPGPLDHAAFVLALTLMDFETPLWLDDTLAADRAVVEALRFHCGCPIVEEPGRANFAFIADAAQAPPLRSFHQGTSEYPDRSTTVVMQVREIENSRGVRLAGPGIKSGIALGVDGLPSDFWRQWSANQRQFPLGVDLVFTAGDRLVALPRSVIAEI
jgi:alpha-D-ribose 1-methylphosphonate 5-triphosphate synthase subunit PhnH